MAINILGSTLVIIVIYLQYFDGYFFQLLSYDNLIYIIEIMMSMIEKQMIKNRTNEFQKLQTKKQWWTRYQYKGKFNQKGEPHDSQAQVKINKNCFKGKIENGLFKQGEFYMGQSRKTYKGPFERFLAFGFGILQGEKQIFQGKWKAGKFIYGTYTIKQNGKHILVYRGQFQNWKFHGIGVYYDLDNKFIYRGQFKQGEKSGYGKLSLLKERWELQGEFRNNQFEQGTHIVYQQPTLKNNEENTRTIVGQVIFQRLQITKVQRINHELVEQLNLDQVDRLQLIPEISKQYQSNNNGQSLSTPRKNNNQKSRSDSLLRIYSNNFQDFSPQLGQLSNKESI